MERVNLPRTMQNQMLTWMQAQILPNNNIRLLTGAPPFNNGASYSFMVANEVAASWYSAKSQSYFAAATNDPIVPNQLNVQGANNEWNYSNGSGSDTPVSVLGYFISGPSSLLVGYAVFPLPVVVQTANDGVVTQPYVPIPVMSQ